MATYTVYVDWEGYSRGTAAYQIEAGSEEEAIERHHEGELLYSDIVRDDTEDQPYKVEVDDAK